MRLGRYEGGAGESWPRRHLGWRWSSDPGDDEILRVAHGDGRVLVTLDKDFGELAIVLTRPHSGILRLVGIAAQQQASLCLQVLASHAAELAAGGLITAE